MNTGSKRRELEPGWQANQVATEEVLFGGENRRAAYSETGKDEI
jgi:hypothetical protein